MEDIQNDWLSHVEASVYSDGRERPGPLTVAEIKKRKLPLQKLLFSATLSQNPEKLEKMNLFEPNHHSDKHCTACLSNVQQLLDRQYKLADSVE